MAKKLTALAVEKVRCPPGKPRVEIPDRGCPGLYLIVQTSGYKSWALRYRSRKARSRKGARLPVKLTLGPVALLNADAESPAEPQIGTPLSLKAARALAAKKLHEVAAGGDPAEEKRQRREAQHAAEADTLQAVCEEHLRRNSHLRTTEQRRDDLELFYPKLGQRPIEEIGRSEFVHVVDAIADERGPRRASRAFGNMKTLLNWHGNRSEYVSKLTRTRSTWRTSDPEGGRDRALEDAEIRAIVLAAEQDQGVFGRYLLFTLLTATRRNESAGLRRSELSDGGKVWTIPANRYKSKRDTLIPLSERAQEIIASIPVLPGGDCVFSVSGARAFNDFAKAKTRFDKLSGVTGWRLHDLRRTARTLLSRAGVRPDIGEMALGHAIGGIRGRYDKFKFINEKREAFEALATLVERIVRPPADVVVPISRRRK